jgi:hypothetical protein
MKAMFVTLAILASSMVAKADGFVCTSESGLVVRVYNHTSAEEGTRTAAIMVLSDSSIGAGNKTIASFSDTKRTLSSSHQVYTAKVDLRVSESNRKGELIAGTKLGQLSKIVLDVFFSYAAPLAHGEEVGAELTLVKRNGDQIVESANCARYLKN